MNVEKQNKFIFKDNKMNNFKAFDKVLVRHYSYQKWFLTFYSYYDTDKKFHVTVSGSFDKCIQFEGNEHLLGTTFEHEITYSEKQKECDLKCGDYVKLTRKAKPHEEGWLLAWDESMNDYIGYVGKIKNISESSIQVEFPTPAEFGYPRSNSFYFPYFVLEKEKNNIFQIGYLYVCWNDPSFKHLAECVSIVKNTPYFAIVGDTFGNYYTFKHYEEYYG